MKIAVYCELEENKLSQTSYEIISKANELRLQAQELNNENVKITAIAIGRNIEEESVLKSYKTGADSFVLIKHDTLFDFNQINYKNAFLEFYKQNNTDVILFPATITGRLISPRITTALDTGLVADCTGIDFILKDNKLKLASTRPTFGSQLMATILSKKKPECATIRPKTFKIKEFENTGKYFEFVPEIALDDRINILKTIPLNTKEVDFENAKLIFCAGFGLFEGKDSPYIEKLKKLSEKYNAQFAVSRKLVDYGFAEHKYQIGQTGATVQPEIYVGFGVSGAIQHISGMKNSKTIIAINTDENAEIFNYANFKITKDAKEIIDEM